jgi:hypothetical protein
MNLSIRLRRSLGIHLFSNNFNHFKRPINNNNEFVQTGFCFGPGYGRVTRLLLDYSSGPLCSSVHDRRILTFECHPIPPNPEFLFAHPSRGPVRMDLPITPFDFVLYKHYDCRKK